jgi:amidase
MAKNMKGKPKRSWQDIVKQVQEYRDASLNKVQPPIPPLDGYRPKNSMDLPAKILQQAETHITEMPPEHLVSKLAHGELTATAVTSAFLRRAVLAQNIVSQESAHHLSSRANIRRPTALQNCSPSAPLPAPNI